MANTELYVNIPLFWTQTLFPLEIVSHFFFNICFVSTSLEMQLFSCELMIVIKEIKYIINKLVWILIFQFKSNIMNNIFFIYFIILYFYYKNLWII